MSMSYLLLPGLPGASPDGGDKLVPDGVREEGSEARRAQGSTRWYCWEHPHHQPHGPRHHQNCECASFMGRERRGGEGRIILEIRIRDYIERKLQ